NTSLSLVYGFNRERAFKGSANNGEYLPLVPPAKITAVLSQQINLPSRVIPAITPTLELEACLRQNRYLGYNNSEIFTPGYVLPGCGVQTEISYAPGKALSLSLLAHNL